MTRKDFSVSVIGGGIGGLSLVIGLNRAGIQVDIFEAAVSVKLRSMSYQINIVLLQLPPAPRLCAIDSLNLQKVSVLVLIA